MFISLGLSGVVPVIHGLSRDGFQKLNEQMSVALVATQGAMYIFGAVLYAVRISKNGLSIAWSLTIYIAPLAGEKLPGQI